MKRGLLFLCIFALINRNASSQWTTQEIPLSPGWNAVHFQVQPEPQDCSAVFTNPAIESVWMWNKRFSPLQYDLDPGDLIPDDVHWLLWKPEDDEHSFLNTFFGVNDNSAYLVKVDTNALAFSIHVKGMPSAPDIDWFPHALNLAGFPVHPASPPTFTDFFAADPAVDADPSHDPSIYAINALGRAVPVYQPARDLMAAGRAYWMKCTGASDYTGPLKITADSSGGVSFGSILKERALLLQNVSTSESLSVSITLQSSEPAPEGQPEVAGDVPLAYFTRSADNTTAWSNFPAVMQRTLAPNETWTLQLGLRRSALAPYSPSGTNGYAWQSLMIIEDADQALKITLPVSADESVVPPGDDPDPHPENEGLWVGEVSLSEVNHPQIGTNGLWDTTIMEPVPLAFRFRLILHVASNGTARLLQRAILAWDDALATNGAYALYADESLVPADCDDATRIASTAFHLMAPAALSGSMTGTLTGTVTLDYNDPVNPFRHTYHPQHDNKDWDFSDTPLSAGEESWTVQREITLVFDEHAETEAEDPVWGHDAQSGTYTETMTGLRKHPVRVSGSFSLQRMGRIGELRQ